MTPNRPTSDLAADVRLRRIEASARSPHQRAHADIGVDDVLWLVARITDLEARQHKCVFPVCVDGEKPTFCGHCGDAERADAAQDKVAALTQERDKWKNRAEYEEDQKRIVAHAHLEEQARAVSAETQLATMRQALADLLENGGWGHSHWDSTGGHGSGCTTCIQQREARDIARRALAATDTTAR